MYLPTGRQPIRPSPAFKEMAKRGSAGTSVPTQGQAFHIPPDIKALGDYGKVIATEMRREHYRLGRHLAPKRKMPDRA